MTRYVPKVAQKRGLVKYYLYLAPIVNLPILPAVSHLQKHAYTQDSGKVQYTILYVGGLGVGKRIPYHIQHI